MLYVNTLKLSSYLGLLYWLSALPRTLGAILINSTLNATIYDGLDNPPGSNVCVNNTEHPNWGFALHEFDFAVCQHAVGLVTGEIEGKQYIPYDFYSRQVYPAGPTGPGQGVYEQWPLAQGSGTGQSKAAPKMLHSKADYH